MCFIIALSLHYTPLYSPFYSEFNPLLLPPSSLLKYSTHNTTLPSLSFLSTHFSTLFSLSLSMFTSPDRVSEYIHIEQEVSRREQTKHPLHIENYESLKKDKKSLIGRVILKAENITARYAPDLPPVLKNLSFQLIAGKLVVIVIDTFFYHLFIYLFIYYQLFLRLLLLFCFLEIQFFSI